MMAMLAAKGTMLRMRPADIEKTSGLGSADFRLCRAAVEETEETVMRK
jgi:hypothetical protein